MLGRIVSLNLRHGGGRRIASLTDWLLSKSPSAVIATEWRNNAPGQHLRNRLTLNGLESILASPATPQMNTVLLAARGTVSSKAATPLNSPVGELVSISMVDGVSILGCYFPQRMAKSPFFRRCIEMAASNSHRPFVMIGDLNTGRNDLDIEGNGVPFHCADQFAALHEQGGLVDLWRLRHGERRDWTWRSARNGFRIDHAFGNQAFINRFPNFRCEIDHQPRVTELTDHSAIILDLE
ncbi:Endonuclease/Exonuclease/phosphatase family protein [Bradyrhizobium erythrophlei]|nr:Endonuclease/Exonuclease/phosphatase family protein [Bradyrhizobium erythrophlei]